jgi:BASS family bile acid:Na+ symporter
MHCRAWAIEAGALSALRQLRQAMTLTALIILTVKVSLGLIVFVVGLAATVNDATYLFRRPEKLLRALLSMYVVAPLFAVAVALAFDLNPAVEIALVALSVSPVPPILPRGALKAGGKENYTVGLLVAASLLAIVLVPLAMEVFQIVFGVALQLSALSVIVVLLPVIFVPLAAGMALRAAAPAIADRIVGPAGMLATVLLFLSGPLVLFGAWPQLLSVTGDGTLAAFVAFALAGLFAGHLFGGPLPEDRTVLALYTSVRHPGVAIAIAQANFPEQKFAMAATVLAWLIAIIVSVPYKKWTKSHRVQV